MKLACTSSLKLNGFYGSSAFQEHFAEHTSEVSPSSLWIFSPSKLWWQLSKPCDSLLGNIPVYVNDA